MPFPVLEAKRLILNKLDSTDLASIVEYASNARVAEMTLNIPHPYREEDAVFWVNAAHTGFQDGSQYTFAIRLRPDNEFIGGMGLKINRRFDRAELGYWIAEPFWNMGFATEAAAAVLKFGFEELRLNKIYATHLIENPASGRVMQKNGMVKEGLLVDHYKRDNAYKTIVQYRMTRKEYASADSSL